MSWSRRSSASGVARVSDGPSAGPSSASSSTSVFQAPHPEHCPDHFGCGVPQSAHACTVLVLVMGPIMEGGCQGEGDERSESPSKIWVRLFATGGRKRAQMGGWEGSRPDVRVATVR